MPKMLREIVHQPLEQLDEREKTAVKTYRDALEALKKFRETGKPQVLGVFHKAKNMPLLSKEELEAHKASAKAVYAAVDYHLQQGMTPEGIEDIKSLSKRLHSDVADKIIYLIASRMKNAVKKGAKPPSDEVAKKMFELATNDIKATLALLKPPKGEA